jgi:TonB-dependent receptor
MDTGFSWRKAATAVFLAVFLVPSLCSQANAQTGTLIGTVIDGEYGDELIGANVLLEGTMIGTSAGLDGTYRVANIPPGTYSVRFSFIGYQTLTVSGVEILAGDITRVDATLAPEAFMLEGDVVVEARAIRDNEATLLKDRQKAVAVSDAISAEAISRSGSGDAAAAMSKVTGASVVGGRYVYIRGLGDRYTNTTLNGSSLPSADPDRKAFQLDMFPSALLDNIVTLKTFTPDKPGDFSGGLVDVSTKTFPDRFTFQVSASVTYDDQATGNDAFLGYKGSGTDWLGRDDGARALPSVLAGKDPAASMPTEQDLRDVRRDVTNEIRAGRADTLNAYARAFNNQLVPRFQSAPVNYSLSTALGGQSRLAGMTVGYTGSVSYGRTLSSYDDGTFSRWTLTGGSVDAVDNLTTDTYFGANPDLSVISRADSLEAGSYVNMQGSDEVNWGTSASVSVRPARNHEVTFTGLRTQSGRSEATMLGGFRDQNPTATFITRAINYQERSLASGQLRGNHFLKPITVAWSASLGRNSQEEPDLRFFSNVQNIQDTAFGRDTTYSLGGGNAPPPQRYFRDLAENSRSAKVDVSVPVIVWNALKANLKVGAAIDVADRTFRQRRFEYTEGRQVDFRAYDGDIDGYLSSSNFGVLDTLNVGSIVAYNAGLYIRENSPARANYDADRDIQAVYGMLELPLTRRLKVIGGARVETTTIGTTSLDASLPDELREARLNERDVLPSVNVVFGLTDNMNIRAAATRTLARPTFRELAPFQSFNFVGGDIQEGNPLLSRTLASNYDLRWESFMRSGELMAVSVFYKEFTDPIERVARNVGEGRFITFQNVDEARVYGAEFEVRKNLSSWTSHSFFSRLSVGGNFSLVRSYVDIPETEMVFIRAADPEAGDTRSLVGQSPYLLNLNASWEHAESGTSVNIYYTVFGDRLQTVTEGATPDVFEKSRADLDLTATRNVSRNFRMKLSAKNILGTDVRQSQTFKGVDYDYISYSRSRQLSIGLTYAIN